MAIPGPTAADEVGDGDGLAGALGDALADGGADVSGGELVCASCPDVHAVSSRAEAAMVTRSGRTPAAYVADRSGPSPAEDGGELPGQLHRVERLLKDTGDG